MNKKTVLDAGTTWSKIIEYNTDELKQIFSDYLRYSKDNKNYYILPSAVLKTCDLKFDAMTGHMSEKFVDNKDSYVNEIIALSSGVKNIEENSIILDLGSRDAKWVRFVDGKFKDLDWNTACASSTGATIEMLMKFYNLKPENLSAAEEKYNITCGIFGLERRIHTEQYFLQLSELSLLSVYIFGVLSFVAVVAGFGHHVRLQSRGVHGDLRDRCGDQQRICARIRHHVAVFCGVGGAVAAFYHVRVCDDGRAEKPPDRGKPA